MVIQMEMMWFYGGIICISGAVTNTLAIHMLFEKVPFLYGSGVIESKFSVFKVQFILWLWISFFYTTKFNKIFPRRGK